MQMINVQRDFQQMKQDASQAYELAHTAAAPGKKSALTGIIGADADYHIDDQNAFLRMVAFVRMMERNDPVVGSAGQRLIANVNVGQMTVSPNTGDPEVDEHLKAAWNEYAADPQLSDAQRRFSYEAQADIAFIRTVFDGDVFVIPEPDGSVLHLEAHRCQTPNRTKVDRGVCGVKTDGRVAKSYFLSKQTRPYGHVMRVADVEPVAAFDATGWPNVFHVFRPARFSLNRGVTSLAPCGTAANRRDDNEFATILKSRMASCVTWSEEITDMETVKQLIQHGSTAAPPLPTSYLSTDDAGYQMATAAMHPGRVLRPELGRKLVMHSPDIPGDGFFDLNMLMIQYLAMNLDLPLIVLLLDAKGANFSSYRNVLDQARMSFGKIQRWFAAAYHRPRFRHFVRTRLRTDSMLQAFVKKEKPQDPRRSAIYRHDWNPTGWKYIHPVDDAQGDVLQLSNSLEDLDRFARRKHGISGEDHVRRVVKYNEFALAEAFEAKQRLEQRFPGAEFDWRYLFAPPNRQGLQMPIADQPPASAGDE